MSIQAFTFDSKYITFSLIEQKPKTGIYVIKTKEEVIESGVTPHAITLGLVKFYPPWRQYSFFPLEGTVFEKQCMRDIVEFMEMLNKDLRASAKARRLAEKSVS